VHGREPRRSYGAAPNQAVQAVNANVMDERTCGVAVLESGGEQT
jgi:hypothetical protein